MFFRPQFSLRTLVTIQLLFSLLAGGIYCCVQEVRWQDYPGASGWVVRLNPRVIKRPAVVALLRVGYWKYLTVATGGSVAGAVKKDRQHGWAVLCCDDPQKNAIWFNHPELRSFMESGGPDSHYFDWWFFGWKWISRGLVVALFAAVARYWKNKRRKA